MSKCLRVWLLRWLAFVAMMILLHVIGLQAAHAQTNTPTPTRTPTNTPTNTPTPTRTPTSLFTPTNTPTSTPTSTGTNTPVPTSVGTSTPTPWPTPAATESPFGTNPYVWGCYIYGSGAPVCTWGDYFEISAAAVSTNGTAVLDRKQLSLIPPLNTKSIVVGCSALGSYHMCDVTSGTCVNTYVRYVGIEGNTFTSLEAPASNWNQFNQGPATPGCCGISQSNYVTITKGTSTAFEDWSAFPITGTFLENVWPYLRIEASARGRNVGSDNTSTSDIRAACQIFKVIREDGTSYVPPGATPLGDFPTPTSTPCVDIDSCDLAYTPNPWATPIGWVNVPDDTAEFGRTPGATTCYTLIPEFSWGPYTVFGYDLAVDFEAFELCNQEYSVGWQVFGINFGAWIAGLLLVAAGAIVYSRFK